jgi:DNA-binding HxlR family transcriptional regulator
MSLVIPDVLDESCATRQALERLAAKWRILLVYALLDGPQRPARLRRRLPGITQKMLTETLRGMEADGLIQRHVHKLTAPQHIEYALTELGKSLEAPLAAICAWAVNHPAAPAASNTGHGLSDEAMRSAKSCAHAPAGRQIGADLSLPAAADPGRQTLVRVVPTGPH